MTQESAIIYIRVSTKEQDNSLEVQEKNLRKYCELKNIKVAHVVIDEDVSGFKEIYQRKGGSKIPALIKSTKIIVAIKPDRLFRNTIDALTTVNEWQKENVSLHIVDMGGASFNTKNAIGRLIFTTLVATSQFERDVTGERIKDISTNKKSQGKVYSRPILGFDSIKGNLIKNEAEQEIIQLIKSLNERFMPTRIARILNTTGYRTKSGRKFHQSTINYIVKNPIYQ